MQTSRGKAVVMNHVRWDLVGEVLCYFSVMHEYFYVNCVIEVHLNPSFSLQLKHPSSLIYMRKHMNLGAGYTLKWCCEGILKYLELFNREDDDFLWCDTMIETLPWSSQPVFLHQCFCLFLSSSTFLFSLSLFQAIRFFPFSFYCVVLIKMEMSLIIVCYNVNSEVTNPTGWESKTMTLFSLPDCIFHLVMGM